MPKLNRADLFSYELAFPERNEQREITTYLDSVQAEVDKMHEALDEKERLLYRLERSVLERAFRGEL